MSYKPRSSKIILSLSQTTWYCSGSLFNENSVTSRQSDAFDGCKVVTFVTTLPTTKWYGQEFIDNELNGLYLNVFGISVSDALELCEDL